MPKRRGHQMTPRVRRREERYGARQSEVRKRESQEREWRDLGRASLEDRGDDLEMPE